MNKKILASFSLILSSIFFLNNTLEAMEAKEAKEEAAQLAQQRHQQAYQITWTNSTNLPVNVSFYLKQTKPCRVASCQHTDRTVHKVIVQPNDKIVGTFNIPNCHNLQFEADGPLDMDAKKGKLVKVKRRR